MQKILFCPSKTCHHRPGKKVLKKKRGKMQKEEIRKSKGEQTECKEIEKRNTIQYTRLNKGMYESK